MPQSLSLESLSRYLSINNALTQFNEFARFIAAINNAPFNMLSFWHNKNPSSEKNAEHFMLAPQQQALMAALYLPSPFPPPERLENNFSHQVEEFLRLTGLANVGIPAEINRAVLKQLEIEVKQAGLYPESASEKALIDYLQQFHRPIYYTLSMLKSAMTPLLLLLDNVSSGMGTALFTLFSFQPLSLLFDNGSTGKSRKIKIPEATQLNLPAARRYYDSRQESPYYSLAPLTTSLFASGFLAINADQSINADQCEAVQSSSLAVLTPHQGLPAVYVSLDVFNSNLLYAVVSDHRPLLISTRGGRPVLSFSKEIPKAILPTQPVSGVSCPLSPPSILSSVEMPASMTSALKSIWPAVYWADGWLGRQLAFFPIAAAENIVSPKPVLEAAQEAKPLTLDKFFLDEYQHLDVSRRLETLFAVNGKKLGVTALAETLLDNKTRQYMLDKGGDTVPANIADYYRCANITITQQPKSWLVNGFLDYLLHLLNIEQVFRSENFNAIYLLMGQFHSLAAKFADRLSAYISPNSGSTALDNSLRTIISYLAFPFQRLKNHEFSSHEMRGWKVLFGLCLEHYFPARLRGNPMETANSFIHLLGDSLQSETDRAKLLALLSQPPLRFIFELMTLDILHERLIDSHTAKVVAMLSEFRQEEVLRYRILSMGSREVVNRLYALDDDIQPTSQQNSIDSIRSSLITSTVITLKFILSNWFYQSTTERLVVAVQSIRFNCWLKSSSRQVSGETLFQGGVVRFDFNSFSYYFFIDVLGECSFLATDEQQAKIELLTNAKFYRDNDIEEAFFEKTGIHLDEVSGGLHLSFIELECFRVSTQNHKQIDLKPAAASFVDNITFNNKRKNRLLGSTFSTRMRDWYNDISATTFLPLWGCYLALSTQEHDKLEKLIICSVEAPTVTLLANKATALYNTIKSALYINPENLFTDMDSSFSSLRTLLVAPRHGILIASDVSLEVFNAEIPNTASAMITKIHGSSVESFSSLESIEADNYYFTSSLSSLQESVSLQGQGVNIIKTSASISDVYSSMNTLRGRTSVDVLTRSQSENLLLREEDIVHFLGLMHGRVREQQQISIQASLQILAETTDALLANIPSLLLRKGSVKIVLYSVLTIATLETFKAYLLAIYNEEKQGGYQETQINDFKLKFIDGKRLSLEFKGQGESALIRHHISLDEPTAEYFEQQGLVALTQGDGVKVDVFDADLKSIKLLNRVVMDRLMLGISAPSLALPQAFKSQSLTGSRVPDFPRPNPSSLIYLRLLTLEPSRFIALIHWLYHIDSPLENIEVLCWKVPNDSEAYHPAHILSLRDALTNKEIEGKLIYPDVISGPLKAALEAYRLAGVAKFVQETNRLNSLQYLRLSRRPYLNYNYLALEQFLAHRGVMAGELLITRVDWQPFNVSQLNLEQAVAQRNISQAYYGTQSQFIFPIDLPTEISVLLFQYLNAKPEQLLNERATIRAANRMAGLGLGQVKSPASPYLTLPPALFLASRITRYGFERDQILAFAFTYCAQGQCRQYTLLEILTLKLPVSLIDHPLLRGNAMLRRELEEYLSASPAERRQERQNRVLYQQIYQRAENATLKNALNATEFILRIGQKYGVSEYVRPDTLIEVIDQHKNTVYTLYEAMEDKTDNTLVSYPIEWPLAACIALDCYRATRFGELD